MNATPTDVDLKKLLSRIEIDEIHSDANSENEGFEPILAFQSLGKEVKDKLGYAVLADKIRIAKYPTVKDIFRTGLKNLPFDPLSVSLYKALMQSKANDEQPEHAQIAKLAVRTAMFISLIILSVILILGSLACSLFFTSVPSYVFFVSGMLGLIGAFYFSNKCGRIGDEEMGLKGLLKNYSWRQTPIKDYKNEIPEFALQTALQIQEAFPDAEIFIDELVGHSDPFLGVKLKDGKEAHYECWNEPGFTKKSSV